MLQFFRRYQRYFLIVVTVIIVVSFSLFGSFSAIARGGERRDTTAFHSVTGRPVKRSELQQMVLFLATDRTDKQHYGPVMGANFLNDGVVRNDFLASGLGEEIAIAYLDQLSGDLMARRERERRYQPYVHPEARFLSAERVWSYFAPTLSEGFEAMRAVDSPASPNGVRLRIALYLEEQKFPQQALKKMLRYQQDQYAWIPSDPYLMQRDLALFGYHTVDEWFGSQFTQLIAQVVINGADMARERGYEVSWDEALAELRRHAEAGFKDGHSYLKEKYSNSAQYMEDQLRSMGLTVQNATNLWRDVVLFRRIFADAGSTALLDPFIYNKFSEYAAERLEIDLYRLDDALNLTDYAALQEFELYLDLVTDRAALSSPLELPTQSLTVDQVKEQCPELIQRRFLVEVAEIHKSSLAPRIGLRELWDWELDTANWLLLASRWPELDRATSGDRRERLQALDRLDKKTRELVDNFAQEQIIAARPEWIDRALSEAEGREMVISVRQRGGSPPLAGIVDREKFGELLEQNDLVEKYSEDEQAFYRIRVLKRSEGEEILSFSEARTSGILSELVQQRLQQRYEEVRRKKPTQFLQTDGQWRPLNEVSYLIADELFSGVVEPFRSKALAKGIAPGELAASQRFFHHLASIQDEIQHKNKSRVRKAIRSEAPLAQPIPICDQWKVVKTSQTALRGYNQELRSNEPGARDPYALDAGEWSSVYLAGDGQGPCFFYVTAKQPGELLKTMKIDEGQKALAREMRGLLLDQLIARINDHHCLVKEGVIH
jgi:GcvH upstream region-like protein